MKKRNRIFATLMAIIGFAACTKIVDTDIGIGDLIPNIDGVTVKDTTLNVIVNTYAKSPIPAIGIEETNILGKHYDTAFGNTNTALYVQMQPMSYPFRFPVKTDSIRTIDSVVLIISTAGLYFGDSTKNIGFRVHEINDPAFDKTKGYPFTTDKNFITRDEITYNNTEQLVSPLSVNDTIKAFGDTIGTPNQIRIRLNKSVAQKLLALDTSNYRTDSLFRLAFHGVKISSTSGNALVPILPARTRLSIYYKYTSRTDGSADTTVTYFVPANTSASANVINTDRSGTQLANLPLGDTATGNSLVYLQSAPGVFARLKIPGVETLPKMFVYRAELLMDDIPAVSYSAFAPNLFVAGVKDNKRILLKDVLPGGIPNPLNPYSTTYIGYYTSNLSTFGTYPLARTDSINKLKYYHYNFNLTGHIQNINKGLDKNIPLDLFAPQADSVFSEVIGQNVAIQSTAGGSSFQNLNMPVVNRTKLLGNTQTPARMRLRIIYSPIQ